MPNNLGELSAQQQEEIFEWVLEGNSKKDLVEQLLERMTQEELDQTRRELAAATDEYTSRLG